MVAAILIDRDGRVLVTDRRNAASMRDMWEFPGGKRRDGESCDDALKRELEEELGVRVVECRHYLALEHDYAEFSVHIDFYRVPSWRGTPSAREGQRMRWVALADLDSTPLLPADRPVIEKLNTEAG